MKICVFTDSFLPYLSGVTFVAINQSNELARRGHELSIFRPRPKLWRRSFPKPKELNADIGLCEVPLTLPTPPNRPDLRIAVPTFLPSLLKVRRLRPELIHVHTEWGCGWEGVLAARVHNIPVVGTFHTFFADPGYLRQFGLPNLRATRAAMWKFSTTFYNRCDAIICPSRETARVLSSRKLRHPPTVISNGIKAPDMKSISAIETMRKNYGITGSPVFLYLGRVSVEKSMDILLHAFRKVLNDSPNARLVIIGAGPSDPEVADLCSQLDMENSVIRTGMIEHDKLIRENLLRLGDVFVTASKTENQPLSLMEAMSFELPLVAADARGNPELVEHERNGFLFEPDNADQMAKQMRKFTRDHPNLTERMGKASGDMIRDHYLPNVGAKLEELYTSLIARQPGG
ncbi:MAG: glycosyltransferase [bacterium]